MRFPPDRLLRMALAGAGVLILLSGLATAKTYRQLQADQPELFHPQTGYRIERQRAPTPDDIPPPSLRVEADEARKLLGKGAIAIDVLGAAQSRYDELDGTWPVNEQRFSLPGAIWLPEIGRGTLTGPMQAYLVSNLERLTGGDRAVPLLFFCIADCWMSCNAAQRAASLGYRNTYWFPEGTDGWQQHGWPLDAVEPVPVNVD